jgi:hypothetical protein
MSGAGVRSGLPDVVLIHDGKVFGLELKAPGGKLSPAQTSAHEQLRAAGCEVATAVGIAEAVACLERWQLLKGRLS